MLEQSFLLKHCLLVASPHLGSCHCISFTVGSGASSKAKSVKLLEVLNALEEEEEEIFRCAT